jgi:hypothetical protein
MVTTIDLADVLGGETDEIVTAVKVNDVLVLADGFEPGNWLVFADNLATDPRHWDRAEALHHAISLALEGDRSSTTEPIDYAKFAIELKA